MYVYNHWLSLLRYVHTYVLLFVEIDLNVEALKLGVLFLVFTEVPVEFFLQALTDTTLQAVTSQPVD